MEGCCAFLAPKIMLCSAMQHKWKAVITQSKQIPKLCNTSVSVKGQAISKQKFISSVNTDTVSLLLVPGTQILP